MSPFLHPIRIICSKASLLFLSQSRSSKGFIAAFTVNALVGVGLTGPMGMVGILICLDAKG